MRLGKYWQPRKWIVAVDIAVSSPSELPHSVTHLLLLIGLLRTSRSSSIAAAGVTPNAYFVSISMVTKVWPPPAAPRASLLVG
eukprot:COSAG01_NODE_5423_length_4272_cov_4.074766_1_plen_83_part_00